MKFANIRLLCGETSEEIIGISIEKRLVAFENKNLNTF